MCSEKQPFYKKKLYWNFLSLSLSTLELLLFGGIYFYILFTLHSRDQREVLIKKKSWFQLRALHTAFTCMESNIHARFEFQEYSQSHSKYIIFRGVFRKHIFAIYTKRVSHSLSFLVLLLSELVRQYSRVSCFISWNNSKHNVGWKRWKKNTQGRSDITQNNEILSYTS